MGPSDAESRRSHAGIRILNLVAPGAGLACAGSVAVGVALGVAYIACLNGAILAFGVIPDEFSRSARILLVVAAALLFVSAQGLLPTALQREEQRRSSDRRRQALADAQAAAAAGRLDEAEVILAELVASQPADLLAAQRLAAILTAQASPGAAAAWRRLRELDRHRIFRAETDFALNAGAEVSRVAE